MSSITLSSFNGYLFNSLFELDGRTSFSRFADLSTKNPDRLVWYPSQPISVSKPQSEKGQFNSLRLIHKYLSQKKISTKHPIFPLWSHLKSLKLSSSDPYFETYVLPTVSRIKAPARTTISWEQYQKLEQQQSDQINFQYSCDMLKHFTKTFQMLESFAAILPHHNEEFEPPNGYLKDTKGKDIDLHYLAKTLLFPDRKLAKKINEWQEWDFEKNTQKFHLDTATNLSQSLLALQEVGELKDIPKAYLVVYCEEKTQTIFACSENPKYSQEEYNCIACDREGGYTHRGLDISQQAFIYGSEFKEISVIYLNLATAQKNVKAFLVDHPAHQYSIALYQHGQLHSLAPLVSKGQKWVDSVNPLIEKNLLNKFTQSVENPTIKTTHKI